MPCSSTRGIHRSSSSRKLFPALRLALLATALPLMTISSAPFAMAQAGATATSASTAPGTPFTAEKLASLLPPSAYFQGKTASLQLRNAGGTAFADGAIVWAALVDSSGYATSVQNRYQFYLVTEGPLRIGSARLAPGAYGGGFLGDRFVIMDVGGHTVAAGPVAFDAAMKRPRPLEVLSQSPDAVRLYLGRHWVELQAAPSPAPAH